MRKRFLFDEDEHKSPVAVIDQSDQNERGMQRRKIVTPIKRKKSFTRHNVEYTIKDDCLTNIPIKQWIANGKYGTVFLACMEHECKYILKMIPLNVDIPTEECDISHPDDVGNICIKYTEGDFMHETDLSIKFGEANIGPKVKMIGFCEDVENKYQGKIKVGYMVQEKYDMTLKEYILNNPIECINNFHYITNELTNKAIQMDEMGYFNEDIHEENIMLKVEGNEIKDIVFIDFGIVGKYLEDTNERDMTLNNTKDFLVQLQIDIKRKAGKLRANRKDDFDDLERDDVIVKRSLFDDEDEKNDEQVKNVKRSLFDDEEQQQEGSLRKKTNKIVDEDYHGESVSWHKPDPTKGFFPRHPEDDVFLKRKHEKEERERDLRKKKKKNKQKDNITPKTLGSLYEQMEQMKIDEENPNPHFGYRQVFYG